MTNGNETSTTLVSDAGLASAWRNFWAVVFEPWNLLLLVGVAILFYLSQPKPDATTNVLAQVLLTLTSGVFGGRIAKHLGSLTEGSVLRARGRSAVRSLKLLLRNTAALEARVNDFVVRKDHIDSQPEVTIRNYEEVIGFCRLLQEETVSSIENWTDIVSEADISSIVGVISDLKATIDAKQDELTELASKQKDMDDVSEQRNALAGQLAEKTGELIALRSVLQRANTGLSVSLPSSNFTKLIDIYSAAKGAPGPTLPPLNVPPGPSVPPIRAIPLPPMSPAPTLDAPPGSTA